jgi:hypothetical protein
MVGQWIALHGGGTIGGSGTTPRAQEAAIDVVLNTAERALVPVKRADLSHYAHKVRRAVMVVAKLGAPVKSSSSPWFFGPYGWVFDEVRVLREPVINVIGMQGLWTIPDPLRAKIEDAVNGTIPIGNVLTLTLPRCALCDRAADKIIMTEDVRMNSADFDVTCHGQIETIKIPLSYMYQRAVQPSVAFKKEGVE